MANELWNVSSGSLIGPHHGKSGQQNQDAFGFLEKDGLLIIAAADGAGSLELSHVGAQLAIDVVIEEAFACSRDHGLDLIVELAIESARTVLMNHPDKDLIGCTLAVVGIVEDEWAVGVAGDAFAIIQAEDGTHELFENPPAGEYANITQLLTSDEINILIENSRNPIKAAAVSTDGLEHASLKNGEPFSGFWTPVFNWAAEEKLDVPSLLEHMNTQDKIDDDTTLVVATRKAG